MLKCINKQLKYINKRLQIVNKKDETWKQTAENVIFFARKFKANFLIF